MIPPAVEVSEPNQRPFVGNPEIEGNGIGTAEGLPKKEVYGAAGILGLQAEGQGCGSDREVDGEEDTHLGVQKPELRAWSRTEDNAIVRLVRCRFFCAISGIARS